MDCQNAPARPIAGTVDLSHFYHLHPDGHRLIGGWFSRAWERRDSADRDCFEPFIFAWFAVNGWAACVTQNDSDREYVAILSRDPNLKQQFADLLTNPDSECAKAARSFAAFWPIFKVADLRQRGILQLRSGDRVTAIRSYFANGATVYEPQCWQYHQGQTDPIDSYLDWQHTLAAIYRVRCNLFHGEKMADSEMDHQIVGSAFRTLIHFFREAGHL